jgi:hypothetical protein
LVQLCAVLRHPSKYSMREGARRADGFLTSGRETVGERALSRRRRNGRQQCWD